MEALINRIPYLTALVAVGLIVLIASTLHAQESPTPAAYPDTTPPGEESDSIEGAEQASEAQDESETPDQPAALSAQEQLFKDFALYRQLLANDMTAEADTVAKRIVELSISENGFDSTETAKALTNLAIVQHRNKDYVTAQQNYEAAIGIIERVEDRLNSQLINPLRGLGAAQLAAGRPDLAMNTFGRAQHVSHVNEGPHNLDQIGIIESLAEIHIYVGEFEKAYDLQDRVYQLYARRYDVSSEDILPALYKRAQWQHRLRLFGRERDTYRRIIKIIERNRGKESLDLIRPLTGLGKAYLYVGGEYDREYHHDSTITTGEIYLKRAKRIAVAHPDSTWEIKEGTFLSLADFYIFSDKAGKAKRAYQDTWDLLSEDESRLANRYSKLEALVLLQDIRPPKYYGVTKENEPLDEEEQFEQGKIVLKFTVNTRGRARNFEIIEAHPPGLEDMERAVLREMRRLIYRPRLDNRDVVPTENMIYTHEFFYRQSDLPNIEGEEPPAKDESDEVAASTSS